MMRRAATLLLALAVAPALAAGEAAPEAPHGTTADDASQDPAEGFELLVGRPGDPERALDLVQESRPGAGDEERDVEWPLARAFALARAGESLRAADELDVLARKLREGVGFEVPSVRFVTRVDAFGVYEDDRRKAYRAGDRLMAYAEFVGFVCEPMPETVPGSGQSGTTWRVSLEVEFALENRLTGKRVESWGPDPVEHVTRSRVHDLHVTRVLDLPEELAAGDYEVKLMVKDTLAEGVSGTGVRRLTVAGR